MLGHGIKPKYRPTGSLKGIEIISSLIEKKCWIITTNHTIHLPTFHTIGGERWVFKKSHSREPTFRLLHLFGKDTVVQGLPSFRKGFNRGMESWGQH